ncbi:MAG TPA: carboxymuconolactone decarboxylase family protein [Acidimicrobiales bacterium]|nr:carboxymuconolactone decarboxylase family protein [Acidimicrobiales bacterium]
MSAASAGGGAGGGSGAGSAGRPAKARIAPVTDPSPEVAEMMSNTLGREGQPPLNIFATLAHNPRILRRFNQMGGTLLMRGEVPAREREIVILRVGWNCRSVYEFGQHTVIGGQAGLTADEIAATARPGEEGWGDDDRLLIRMADELCDDDCVSDDTWAALSRRWSESQLVELLVLAGFYRLVSGFLNSAGVELDPGVPGWPQGATWG